MNPALLRQTKGEETRAQILDAAVHMASEHGFESLTIGSLAEKTGLSKSGLFAHFGSKLDLQIAAFEESGRRFAEEVFLPVLKIPRGLLRFRALFEAMIDWPRRASLPGGCPMDAATQEYDHKPGPMHDIVFERQKVLEQQLARTVQLCIDTGEFAPDTDTHQVAFEVLGLVLAYNRAAIVMGPDIAKARVLKSFDRLVDSARPPITLK